jgi:predicted 3-demethylubiquinone-9 3-methyltransferase (glyoxalase superfamily)
MPELQKLTPFLMFQKGDAEEAMTFYTELFDDGDILFVERFGAGEPGPEGSIRQGIFTVAGQQVRVFDSPPQHDFDFTPSMSLFVRCASREEQEKLWAGLSEGGTPLMPLSDYGFGPFGWTNDRFGVSWQLSLS